MNSEGGLEGLRGLHADLLALSDSQLRNIDRLWAELDDHIGEFRKLLDKHAKNEVSRKALSSGTITIDEEDYSVNQEFQENVVQASEALNLDEIESAKLLLEAQRVEETPARSLVASAIINFHQRRNWLLECLRLLLKLSQDSDLSDEGIQVTARELLGLILETKDGPARNGSLYIRKCLDAMSEIERWLHTIGDQIQGAIALGQTLSPEFDEVMSYQQKSLREQHESLSAIISTLIRSNFSSVDDFYKVLDYMPKIERWSILALHYVPVLAAFSSEYGSADGSGSLRDARMLDKKIMDGKNNTPWPLRNLQASVVVWWLAEYSGWYSEQPTGSPVQGVNLEAEAAQRSIDFGKALADGAFQCILSICTQTSPFEWYDPTRAGLIQILLQDSQPLPQDVGSVSDYFRTMLMEHLENFVDGFISNMPDTLRRFKTDEDMQRKAYLKKQKNDIRLDASIHGLSLERFLIITAFAFDGRSEAAHSFWSDTDSNLYGFLQWTSKRQSTPVVSAFCEMLRAISTGEECAVPAHHFLLQEGDMSTAKIRRSASLSWSQMFREMSIYASKIKEPPQTLRSSGAYIANVPEDNIDEPESVVMLQNYLRLMAHLCTESKVVRSWVMSQQEFNLLEILFQFCTPTVPSRLQACAIGVVRSLLTSKTDEMSQFIWTMVDQWISGAFIPQSVQKLAKTPGPVAWTEDVAFAGIAGDFEYLNEFCSLLLALVEPPQHEGTLNDKLPFPENLGSSYRAPGIGPYIDFLLGKVLAVISTQIEAKLQRRVLTWNILNFVVVSLATFNENLVILGNRPTASVDDAMNASSLEAYIRLHPFARVMEWLFNSHVLAALFAASHQPIDEVAIAADDSPLMLGLIRAIEIMNLIIDLQSTYLDLVRPALKSFPSDRGRSVLDPSLSSFEDSVATNLRLVVDLGLYTGIGNQELAFCSLQLLNKLSASRKLNTQPPPGVARGAYGNRLIGALSENDDLDRVARSMCLSLEFDGRELDEEGGSSAWRMKTIILDFLDRSLSATPNQPSLAHALLGFACFGTTISVTPDGLFASGTSLFHAILNLAQAYPDGDESSVLLWAVGIKQKAMGILNLLWTSSLTSTVTLNELRDAEFLSSLFLLQRPLNLSTHFDGRLMRDTDFMLSESASALAQFLSNRCCVIEYASLECRLLSVQEKSSLKGQTLATLLGSTSLSGGSQVSNMTAFDLLDFFELDVPSATPMPEMHYFKGVDFQAAIQADGNAMGQTYDMGLVDETIRLHYNDLRRSKTLDDPNDLSKAEAEASQITVHFLSRNNQVDLRSKRYETMAAWSELINLVIKTSGLDASARLGLILQTFQITTSKFDFLLSLNAPEAELIANLIFRLFPEIDFTLPSISQSSAGGIATDRLFQVFRTAFRGTSCPGLGVQLRETLYGVCHQYLEGMATASVDPANSRHNVQGIRNAGERIIDIICDDAYGASANCRISALTLLNSLANLAMEERSDHIINSILRTNFLQILVESIEDTPAELRRTNAKDIPVLLSLYEWKFSLILTVSRSKKGAAILTDAGFFNALRASGLFSVDPDIGIEIDNPEALVEYYKLLLAMTKIVVSIVVSRGPANEQVGSLVRSFLIEHRPILVAVFKRDAKIGGISFDDAGMSIQELVDLFILLIAMTGFLEYEEQLDNQRSRKLGFS